MPKIDINDIEFKIVPPEYARGFIDYENAPIVQTLIEGNIILVGSTTGLYRLFQFLKSKNYKVHKRKIEEGILIWITVIDGDEAPKS